MFTFKSSETNKYQQVFLYENHSDVRIFFLKRRFGHILHFILCSFERWQFMCHSKQHIGKMLVKVAVFKINIILSIFMDFVYFHHI